MSTGQSSGGPEAVFTRDQYKYLVFVSKTRYNQRNPRVSPLDENGKYQPYTLQYLATEFIKKHQFVTLSIRRYEELRKNNYLSNDETTRLYHQLIGLERKDSSAMVREIIRLVNEGQIPI